MNAAQKQETKYLEEIKARLKKAIEDIDERVKEFAKDVKEAKQYLYENKTGMDHVEKVSVRQSVEQGALVGEAAVEKRKRLFKLLQSPYFGRIDFRENGKNTEQPVYIGVHAFTDEQQRKALINDWRAPISSMYYDFELGEAHYDAPSGKISGEISLKRQYRIRYGKMEYMLESSVNVYDDILQKELSKASDEKMKNIVATIQRDQNAIIRNETSQTLIIQGVAGSGKTSIALHRIAFLLYRFKETIQSKDILIISPNKVFADYISNVLPELGEEKIPEMGMEELANELLEYKYKFQSFFEQVSHLLDKGDEPFKERIRFKAGFEFLSQLEKYAIHIENDFFEPKDLPLRRKVVPVWFIRERFDAYHRIPLLKRFPLIVKDIEENVDIYYKYELTAKERNEVLKAVTRMFKITNIRELYKHFFIWIDKPEMYKQGPRSSFEYADVFPLIYLKIRLDGYKSYARVKHLLVDEMQDYTPVQYAVIAKLFACKKTILGDANQSVNPYSSTKSVDIARVFTEADTVMLNKSYRSTFEITNFAQKVQLNPILVPIERHGEEPIILQFKSIDEEIEKIKQLVSDFKKSEHHSFGIVCKTQKQAEKIFDQLGGYDADIALLTSESSSFSNGVVVTSAHMAKGLEFDWVVIPQATTLNYKTQVDKSMLYIACTRAMHRLVVTHAKAITEFL